MITLDNTQWKSQQVEAEKPGRQAAVDLYELKVCSRVMAAWVEATKDEKRRQYGYVMKAIVFQRRQESPVISFLNYYFQNSAAEIFLHVDEVQFAERFYREDGEEY